MVRHLFIKREHKRPLESVGQLEFSPAGIVGNVECSRLRQVLLVSSGTISKFGMRPGNLRENVVIEHYYLQSLTSGTVLQIGEAMIRLTFHCEPCSTIKKFVNPRDIRNDRGYLGQFLNSGTIRIGDDVKIDDLLSFEEIPHTAIERLRWFLARHDDSIFASDLVRECGLSAAYTRALPALLKKISPDLQRKVVYKKGSRG